MRNQLYLSVLISITLNFVYAQQFTPQFTGLGADGITSPYHMVAIDENTLWASASNPNGEKFGDGPNVIVHTEDGGSTWKSDTLPADNPNAFTIACISAIGPDSAWVSSIDNTANYPNWDIKIYATFDGGENWQLQNVAFSDNESYGGQIHFFDHLEGMLFAASADGYFQVFKTFDAGNTWDRLPQENFPPLIGNFEGDIDNGYYAIQDTIWVPTSEGRILKSIDRGTTWAAFDTPVPSNVIFEVTFSDSRHGIARYTNTADWYAKKFLVTTDGGETWQAIMPEGLGLRVFDLNSVPNQPGEYLCTSYSGSAIAVNKLYYSQDNGATWTELEQANVPGRIALLDSGLGWISELASNTLDIDIIKMEGAITKNEAVVIEGVSIYPNPFAKMLIIDNDNMNKLKSATIFDCFGRTVYSSVIDSKTPTHVAYLDHLSSGSYFLCLEYERGFHLEKIIKQ